MAGYSNLCHLTTVLRLNSDPETFPPADFDDENEDGAGEYDEILPWDPGVWGVSVFGFTDKPNRVAGPRATARTRKDARLSRELLLSAGIREG
jgi:hypothetical protein